MSLDTLTNLKTRVGISTSADDNLLALLQSSAEQWIQQYCQRDFAGGTFTEYFAGSCERFTVSQYPIVEVVSLKVDPALQFGNNTLVPITDYVVHSERGTVESRYGPFVPAPQTGLVNSDRRTWDYAPRAVQIVYTTATNAVPDAVKEALARLVVSGYRRVKTHQSQEFVQIQQQKIGDAFVIFGSTAADLPPEVRLLLEPFRTPNL